MAENYDLIFGQSASQQYAWSDSDYQNGWQTVGSTPPTAEQFDALQRRSDTKAQDLNNRLSPIEEKSEADGRQAATAYTAGAMLTVDGLPNGWLLQCIVPGISGTDAITLPDTLIDGLTIIDGDVTWALRKVATNGGLGYRQPNTTYTAGQIAYHSALPTGYYLECTTQGTTSAGEITPSSTIGGTVTDGTVTWTVNQGVSALGGATLVGNVFKKTTDNNFLIISGGNTKGATLLLHGGTRGGELSGRAELYATKDDASSFIELDPNGSLVHAPIASQIQRNDLGGSAIVAKSLNGGNGYIKYASGLIIQWITKNGASTNGIYTVNFPISFTNANSINVIPWLQDDKGVKAIIRNCGKNLTQAQFVIFDSNFNILSSFSTGGVVGALAIGY